MEQNSQNTKLINNQLNKLIGEIWTPYIKPSLQVELIGEAHIACGHIQMTKNYEQLKQRLFQ